MSTHIYIRRNYHSYPDPEEKPVISTQKSEAKKQILKEGGEFTALQKKFTMGDVYPGVPPNTPASQLQIPSTLVSKLANDLTVGSQEMYGMMSSVALIVGSGSSHEAQNSVAGVSHMLELTAFKSTDNRTHQQLMTELERLGGVAQCISTRENIMYCVDVLRERLEDAMHILADTVINPQLTDEEIEMGRTIMTYQASELPAEVLSRDAVQRAAYQGPMSNLHYAPLDRVHEITRESLVDFRAKHFHGSNMVLAGAGVDHTSFVKLAEKYFHTLPSKGTAVTPRAPSVYTGGLVTEQRELQEEFVKVAVAFEVGGWHSDILVPVCVLQQLLGGGSSFSAGGPGKGMYTRLYREVLNKNHWVEASEAFVQIHEENGLLGIDGSCKKEHIPYLLRTHLEQLAKLTISDVDDVELSRAKNMLKSSVLMQLESRLVLCEDISRQLLTYKKRETPQSICEKIDRVTKEDIKTVAMRMFTSRPSIACVGHDISAMPDENTIDKWFGRHE